MPCVIVNMAITADGKIATANRAVSSFGSARDRDHLLKLRATADAVMSGARTVDLNRINLGPGAARYRRLRLKRGLREYNLRLVASRSGTVAPDSEIFRRRFSAVIVLTTGRITSARLQRLRALADEVKVCGRKEINFRRVFQWLRQKWGVKRLICEGGGEVNDALFRAGVVDELHLTICPKIFGGRDAPTIAEGLGVSRLSQAKPFRLKSARRVEEELFVVYCSAARASNQRRSDKRLR
jgi:riboflavin-specific deaminase-like protein